MYWAGEGGRKSQILTLKAIYLQKNYIRDRAEILTVYISWSSESFLFEFQVNMLVGFVEKSF